MSGDVDLFGVEAPAPPRETERTMLDRLNRRYDKRVTNGGWTGAKYLRAEHVPIGLSWQRSRICDFIAVNMHSENSGPDAYTFGQGYDWSVRAPVLHGHEVKVSRSDWLAELADPTKAETFRRHMHAWWLVVSDRSIVRDDLPDGWGLMVASGAGLRAAVKPTVNERPEPMPSGLVGALMRATVTTESRLTTPIPDRHDHQED